MIVYRALLARLIKFNITILPFICLIHSKKEYIKRGKIGLEVLINHERIHLKQQKELTILGIVLGIIGYLLGIPILASVSGLLLFYGIYVLNWVVNIFKHGKKAYINISFEREAYTNAKDLKYLNQRKPFAWIDYLFK